ncbi:HlyD family secretion protein [Zooshikella harenae]|uniref:Efflux RND transporter periplasmic adaptor subunit n=1 Tax=Zooshikella harenae TaxID=2827238 RepID=A0ABS5ZD05_9GAMM|nr:HlyD family efflux transporter periplasmic adaptor subunit [Zooshikella harenae]MBU2711934.1 efflux RND transporter periplasmic adaptor subunit [Zooshikella harenae]
MSTSKKSPILYWIFGLLVLAGVVNAIYYTFYYASAPTHFAMGNGRLEANDVHIASKLPGRIERVTVKEGDKVVENQLVVKMDTKTLEAQLKQADSQILKAKVERQRAMAVVEERNSECKYAKKQLQRTQDLIQRKFASEDDLDTAQLKVETTQAVCAAAEAMVEVADASIQAAQASAERLQVDLEDSSITSPVSGRVLYRIAEPGEIVASGSKILTIIDLSDVYMTVFLSEADAGKVSVGSDARIILDAFQDLHIPAKVSFISPLAQFTPKVVETREERSKLRFRIKVRVNNAFLQDHIDLIKPGMPGMAYIKLNSEAKWSDIL